MPGGKPPGIYQKVKAMPPALSIQHTDNIAFTEDFTSTIPVSVTELTSPYCRCGSRVGSTKDRLEAPSGKYAVGVRRAVVVAVAAPAGAGDMAVARGVALKHRASPVMGARRSSGIARVRHALGFVVLILGALGLVRPVIPIDFGQREQEDLGRSWPRECRRCRLPCCRSSSWLPSPWTGSRPAGVPRGRWN